MPAILKGISRLAHLKKKGLEIPGLGYESYLYLYENITGTKNIKEYYLLVHNTLQWSEEAIKQKKNKPLI